MKKQGMLESVNVVNADTTTVDTLSADLAAMVVPQTELNEAIFDNEKKLEEELEISQAKGEAVQVASSDNGLAAMLLTDTNAQSAGGAAASGGAAAGLSTGAMIGLGAAAIVGVGALAYSAGDDGDKNSAPVASSDPTPAPNTAPTAPASQSVNSVQGKSVLVTVTATDAEGDSLTFAPSNPANGQLAAGGQPGQYTYTSNPTFVGADTFTVTVTDEHGASTSQTITVNVTKAPLTPAEKTFDLTTGQDAVVGSAEDDTINAKNPTAANTLSAFDTIDGGAGTDTLNIFTDGATNAAMPSNVTIKNVEIVNILNSGIAVNANLTDASAYQGVTQLSQTGANAAKVTNLLATTTAGFTSTTSAMMVEAGAAATSATVNLKDTNAGLAVNVGTSTTAKLASVTVTGTKLATAPALVLGVTVGKDVEAATVSTSVASTLTVNDGAGTKKVATVDASGSTGAITYSAANTVATVKTGAGNDTVTLNTATSATVNAVAETGAGDDAVTVSTTGAGLTTVSLGDGKNTLSVTGNSTKGLTVTAGAGNDTVNLATATGTLDIKTGAGNDLIQNVTLATSTKIDGGAGIDTLEITTGGALVAQDYVLLSSTVSNVEQLKFGAPVTGAGADGSKLGQFSQIEFVGAANKATNIASAQAIIASDINVTAAGFAQNATTKVVTGGVLNITTNLSAATNTVVAQSDVVNLTVSAPTGVDNVTALSGALTTANVTLGSTVDKNAAGVAIADNDADMSYVSAAGAKTFVVSGIGMATVDNSTGNSLTTINASGLSHTDFNGDIKTGLNYTSGTSKEAITLSSGQDTVVSSVTASTYGSMDTVNGFDAVKETNNTKSTTDKITFAGTNLDGSAVAQATKVTLSASATTLDLAFVEAAKANDGATTSFFQFGGNTYLFKNDTLGAPGTGTLESSDSALAVTGLVDFASAYAVFV
jgi:hypothetical protein